MSLKELAPFRHVKWHPDGDELRRFAMAMLVGFAVLGLLAAWRRHHLGPATYTLWAIGAALALGARTPVLGRAVYLGVYLPTSVIGYVVSHVILLVVFGAVFTPLALLLRLMGKDLLQFRPRKGGSYWVSKAQTRGRESYYRQY